MASCANSDLSEYPDFGALADDWNPAKLAAINADELNATLETPVKQTVNDESVDVPETNKDQSPTTKVETAPSSPGASNTNISHFDPNAMSTPAKFIQTPDQQQRQSQSQSLDSINSTLLAPPPPNSTNYSSPLINQQFTYAYQYPTNTITYSIGSFESNSPIHIPPMTSNVINQYSTQQYSANLIKMSSEATTTTSAIPSTVISSFQINENPIEIERLNRQIQSRQKPGHRAKRSRFKSAAFKELENLDPNTIQPKVSGNANLY